MKKILLLSNMYPSSEFPHYGVFVKQCETVLQQGGHQVDRAVIQKQSSFAKKLLSYLHFYTKALWMGLTGSYDCVYAHYASHMLPIVALLRRLRPELFIVTNVHGNDIVPVIPQEEKNPARSKKTLDFSDLVVAPSEYFKTVLCEQYGMAARKVVVFPSGGVNRQIFAPTDAARAQSRQKSLTGKQEIVVGCIARLEKAKGWDTFLEAVPLLAAAHPEWRFVLVGDGSCRAACEAQVAKLPCRDKVILKGLLSQQELAMQTNQMDILCVPSLQESLGLVGLEGMACGVPCVISAIPGMLCYAKNGENCMTFTPGNAHSLAAVTETMYRRTDAVCGQMFARQMATAESYDAKKLGSGLADLFDTDWKRVLLVNQGQTDNFGDQAIALALANTMEEKGFLVEQAGYDTSSHANWDTVPAQADSGRAHKLPLTVKWLLKKKWELYRVQSRCRRSYDAVLIGGGQLLKSNCYFPFAFRQWTRFARKYAAKRYLIGVGADKALYFADQKLYAHWLKYFDRVYVRDGQSQDILLKKLSTPAVRIPDVAFLLNHTLEAADSTRRDYAVVMPYNYSAYKNYLGGSMQPQAFRQLWIDAVEAELSAGRPVVLAYTTQEDLCQSRILYQEKKAVWGSRVSLADIHTLAQLVDVLRQADTVYSGRMHALILAAMLKKPVVCICLSDKLASFENDYLNSTLSARQAEINALAALDTLCREI